MSYPRHQLARNFKFVTKGTNTACNSDSVTANVDTALDLTIAAQVGDVVECTLNAFVDNTAPYLLIDAVSVVSGSPVNSWGRQAVVSGLAFVPAWRANPSVYTYLSGSAWKTIAASDLASGLLTVRLRYHTILSGTKTLVGGADGRMMFAAINLGPQDPN